MKGRGNAVYPEKRPKIRTRREGMTMLTAAEFRDGDGGGDGGVKGFGAGVVGGVGWDVEAVAYTGGRLF